jgi:hypothetical protein
VGIGGLKLLYSDAAIVIALVHVMLPFASWCGPRFRFDPAVT